MRCVGALQIQRLEGSRPGELWGLYVDEPVLIVCEVAVAVGALRFRLVVAERMVVGRRIAISPASLPPRASARTLVLCLVFLRMHYCCAIQTLRCAAPRPFSLRPPTETEAHRQQPQLKRSRPAHPNTNPIVPRGGFLQVAVSEAPLHSASDR
jgi:hypothetical protein